MSMWFLVVVGFIGFRSAGQPAEGALWVLCVFVSILVHELGHGLVSKRLRLQPRILLHGWGGLCAHERADSDRDDVLIIAAGPGAGLLLGGLVYATREILLIAAPQALTDPMLFRFFEHMLFINIAWSLVNLVPLWPLDGGQLFRIALVKLLPSARTAEQITHVTGLILGGGAVVLALTHWGSMFLVVLAGLLAYENLTRINSTSASGPVRPKHTFARGLLGDAERALAEGDFREAARLCHQIRSDANVSGKQLERVWEVLALSYVGLADYDEARDYAGRARNHAAIAEAWFARASETGDPTAARALLESAASKSLDDQQRQAIEALADARDRAAR